jgi:hypothetical protein
VRRRARRNVAALLLRGKCESEQIVGSDALEGLDWCEDYLYRIGKPEIAKEIANNRSMIRRRMRGDD